METTDLTTKDLTRNQARTLLFQFWFTPQDVDCVLDEASKIENAFRPRAIGMYVEVMGVHKGRYRINMVANRVR